MSFSCLRLLPGRFDPKVRLAGKVQTDNVVLAMSAIEKLNIEWFHTVTGEGRLYLNDSRRRIHVQES